MPFDPSFPHRERFARHDNGRRYAPDNARASGAVASDSVPGTWILSHTADGFVRLHSILYTGLLLLLLFMWRSNVDPILPFTNTYTHIHTQPIQQHQLERRDQAASQTLRAALTKAEQAHPGLSYDIVVGILKKGDLKVNMNESILRLQGGASETDRESTGVDVSECAGRML